MVVVRTRLEQSRLDSARKWNSRRVSLLAHSALDAKWGTCRRWPGDPRQCHMHWSRPVGRADGARAPAVTRPSCGELQASTSTAMDQLSTINPPSPNITTGHHHARLAAMHCQKCRTPLKLDSSLEDLNPAAYDVLVGRQPSLLHPPPRSPSQLRTPSNPPRNLSKPPAPFTPRT